MFYFFTCFVDFCNFLLFFLCFKIEFLDFILFFLEINLFFAKNSFEIKD